MTYTAAQRRRAEARQRALQRQAEKARHAVPQGFVLSSAGHRTVPTGCYMFEGLAEMVGASGMEGFVLVTSCRVRCSIYGKSFPSSCATPAWSLRAYRCTSGDRIDLTALGRGSGPRPTTTLYPFVRDEQFEWRFREKMS